MLPTKEKTFSIKKDKELFFKIKGLQHSLERLASVVQNDYELTSEELANMKSSIEEEHGKITSTIDSLRLYLIRSELNQGKDNGNK